MKIVKATPFMSNASGKVKICCKDEKALFTFEYDNDAAVSA
jgi:hypothetical protein